MACIIRSPSAAGQAITTYIRNHMRRCEEEQDRPLLSRHALSGTPSDDDLVSALHSRSGGAHCPLPPDEARLTNFRRGTIVWYLSRAAGGSCPFSRAGIRLSEYTEDGKRGCIADGPRERKRERDRRRRLAQQQQQSQLCGQKRKRFASGCRLDLAEDEPQSKVRMCSPAKVKLTLRLRPSLASSSKSPPPDYSEEVNEILDDDESILSSSAEESESDLGMSVDSDEDSEEDSSSSFSDPLSTSFFRMPSPSSFARDGTSQQPTRLDSRRESSIASPPPDSEDDEEFMARLRYDFDEEEEEEDMDWSDEEEEMAQVKVEEDVTIKRESMDEYDKLYTRYGIRHYDGTKPPVTPLTAMSPHIKIEELDWWDFEDFGAPLVKEEDEAESVVFSPVDDYVPRYGPSRWPPLGRFAESTSPSDERRAWSQSPTRGLLWQNAEILGLDSIPMEELDDGEWIVRAPELLSPDSVDSSSQLLSPTTTSTMTKPSAASAHPGRSTTIPSMQPLTAHPAYMTSDSAVASSPSSSSSPPSALTPSSLLSTPSSSPSSCLLDHVAANAPSPSDVQEDTNEPSTPPPLSPTTMKWLPNVTAVPSSNAEFGFGDWPLSDFAIAQVKEEQLLLAGKVPVVSFHSTPPAVSSPTHSAPEESSNLVFGPLDCHAHDVNRGSADVGVRTGAGACSEDADVTSSASDGMQLLLGPIPQSLGLGPLASLWAAASGAGHSSSSLTFEGDVHVDGEPLAMVAAENVNCDAGKLGRGLKETMEPLSLAEEEMFRVLCDLRDSDSSSALPVPTTDVLEEEKENGVAKLEIGDEKVEKSHAPLRRSRRVAQSHAETQPMKKAGTTLSKTGTAATKTKSSATITATAASTAPVPSVRMTRAAAAAAAALQTPAMGTRRRRGRVV
jgi:hypothetical protein